jgi:hypothetical protein
VGIEDEWETNSWKHGTHNCKSCSHFFGFVVVIVLMSQASAINAVTGSVTLANSGPFFGVIFFSLLCVLIGGYLLGKYMEKSRNEKQGTSPPPP